MKTLAAICAVLILTIISEKVEGLRPFSRDKLLTGTPAFRKEPGRCSEPIPISSYDPTFKKDWVLVEIDICFPVHLYCPREDPHYCLLLDYMGHIAGVQYGYPACIADEVRSYNFSSNPNYEKIKIFGIWVYIVRIYFTNPVILTISGRKDLSEPIEGLWTEVDGEWLRWDQRCRTIGPSLGRFYLQGCYPYKGILYVYNLHEFACCTNPFYLFLVYDGLSMVGFGHGAPGYFPSGAYRDWFDHPEGEKLARIVPSRPNCFEQFLLDGLSTIVTFLIDDPYNIKCEVCGC
ncbi:uncharacterized protein [Halyomorpha halys]|uniref:uncharacterized protein n=1 Tax=Halyomorpha halys TaxID=286706 RepID=UPI0006D50306|nr:uncharacterized protein LOC106681187 [Halyomorpha halys]